MLTSPKLIEPVQMARGIWLALPLAGRPKPRRRPARTPLRTLTASERRLEVERFSHLRSRIFVATVAAVALSAAALAGGTAASPRKHGDREFVQHNLVSDGFVPAD